MSASILAIISHLPQLRGSVRSTAQRLAYFADSLGRCQKSYTYLAADRHVHRSTAQRHIARLLAADILEKQVVRLAGRWCAINRYRLTAWVMTLVHKRAGSRTHPGQTEREKKSSAPGRPTRPLSLDENLQGCREVLARLGLVPRSP